jgi:hypothetical protein
MSNDAGLGPQTSEVPTIEKRKVPRRKANSANRSREYLTDTEVTALMNAAAHVGRHGAHDATLVLIAYRHGLRISELASLLWDQVNLEQGLLHVVRRKNGIASVHPLRGPELPALRRLQRDYPHSAYIFIFASERKVPLTVEAIRKIVTGLDVKPVSSSRSTHICCVTALDTNWLTTARIRGQFNNTWDTAISRTPPAIPIWHRIDSKISGVIGPKGYPAHLDLCHRLLRAAQPKCRLVPCMRASLSKKQLQSSDWLAISPNNSSIVWSRSLSSL